jgi:hypothetical protein
VASAVLLLAISASLYGIITALAFTLLGWIRPMPMLNHLREVASGRTAQN